MGFGSGEEIVHRFVKIEMIVFVEYDGLAAVGGLVAYDLYHFSNALGPGYAVAMDQYEIIYFEDIVTGNVITAETGRDQ